ncbi:MAG: response regulator [Armatimonadota bacterium]
MAKRVLIADGALFMRATLRKLLLLNGFNVVGEAETGIEAVKQFAKLKPDLVMMDISLPDLDGMAVLKEIRKVDPNARVVICTAMGQKSVVLEAVQAGANDFIVKPFQPERLVEAVKKQVA